MLALALGYHEDDALRLPSSDGSTTSFSLVVYKHRNDEERLMIYLQKLLELTENSDDFRTTQIKMFITHYHDYLTTMPDSFLLNNMESMEQAREQDKKLFMEATNEFKTYVREHQRYENMEKRLAAIPLDFTQYSLALGSPAKEREMDLFADQDRFAQESVYSDSETSDDSPYIELRIIDNEPSPSDAEIFPYLQRNRDRNLFIEQMKHFGSKLKQAKVNEQKNHNTTKLGN